MNTAPQTPVSLVRSITIGERAPEFHLPNREGIPTTFYERYCGQETLVLLANQADELASFKSLGEALSLLFIVPQTGDEIDGEDECQMHDDGRLMRVLAGELPRSNEVIALHFDTTLRLRQRISNPPLDALRKLGSPQYLQTPVDAIAITAPILILPEVLDPALCQQLIAAHDADNYDSGMMRLVDGEIRMVKDDAVKARRDHLLEDAELIDKLKDSLARHVLPAITGAFHYRVSRFEGFKIVAYDAQEAGHFRAHRDNMSPDAKHRRFALSINLNEDYQGGGLVFPEFGPMQYRAPAGGAMVFSGALLHEARPVTAGRRYVALSFLWGDEAQG